MVDLKHLTEGDWWLNVAVGKFGVPIALAAFLLYYFVMPLVADFRAASKQQAEDQRTTLAKQAASAEKVAESVAEMSRSSVTRDKAEELYSHWIAESLSRLCNQAKIEPAKLEREQKAANAAMFSERNSQRAPPPPAKAVK